MLKVITFRWVHHHTAGCASQRTNANPRKEENASDGVQEPAFHVGEFFLLLISYHCKCVDGAIAFPGLQWPLVGWSCTAVVLTVLCHLPWQQSTGILFGGAPIVRFTNCGKNPRLSTTNREIFPVLLASFFSHYHCQMDDPTRNHPIRGKGGKWFFFFHLRSKIP